MKTKFFGVVFFAYLVLFSRPVWATEQATQNSFTLSPYFQNIDVAASDENVPFSVNVTNTTDAPAVFRLSVLDFGTLDESGGVAFLGSSSNLKYGLASWVSLPNDTLVLKPGETQSVKGTIKNQESLSPGGHYGALFFRIEDNTDQVAVNKDNVAFNPSFASLFFVRKIGGETYGLKLSNFDFTHNILFVPKALKLRFQNTGNTHIAPRGIVTIADPLGRPIEKGIINNASALILPETFRIYPVSFLSLARTFIPGRYTLAINYRYDGKDDLDTEQFKFFFLPPFFIAFVLGLALLFFVYFKYLNRKEKNGDEKNGK